MDNEGNAWVAERCEHRPGITVYSPDGKEIAHKVSKKGYQLP